MLGNEPVEDEIPVEYSDFPQELQTAFEIYQILQDVWEGMSGTYMGKNLTSIKDVLEIYDVEESERRFVLELIALIDRERIRQISEQKKQEDSLKNNKSPP